MKIFAVLGCYFCIFSLFFTDLVTSNPVNALVKKAHEWANRKCFKDQPLETVRAIEGEPFKITCQRHDDYPDSVVSWVVIDVNDTVKSINNSRLTVDLEGDLLFSNVTKSDASDDFYYACVILSPSKNEYKVGNRVILDVGPSDIMANPIEPMKRYVSKRNEVALRGKEFELFCVYGGSPSPVTLWERNGEWLLTNDRVQKRNDGQSLLIKNVRFDNRGVYTCVAFNGVGATQSYSIDLEVEPAPLVVLSV